MKHRINGVLENIEARNVNTQYGAKIVYDMRLQDGTKLATWKKEAAEKAWSLKGRNTFFDCDVKQNGDYTNYTVQESDDVAEAASMEENVQGAAMFSGAGAMVTGPPTTASGTATFTTTAPLPAPSIDKDTSIHRQVAAKVASQISTTSDEFWKNVLDLFNYFQTGQTGSLMQEIKAEENQGTQAPTDTDDIPF